MGGSSKGVFALGYPGIIKKHASLKSDAMGVSLVFFLTNKGFSIEKLPIFYFLFFKFYSFVRRVPGGMRLLISGLPRSFFFSRRESSQVLGKVEISSNGQWKSLGTSEKKIGSPLRLLS